MRRLAILAGLLAAGAGAADSRAETRLHGNYVVSLAGIVIGRGHWDVRLEPHGFSAAGGGGTVGVAALFSSGKGEARAAGDLRAGVPEPGRYDYASTTRRKFDEVHIRLTDRAVVEARVDPPAGQGRKRVKLEEEHRKGVFDPVSAVLFPVRGALGPESCGRVLPVFDGRMRYDLAFSFARVEEVATEKGYRGPAVVCRVRFKPIAGYVPDRPAIRYLVGLENMEMWLAPVAGTGLAVPWRVRIPTPFGTAEMEAERFEVSGG